MSNKRGNVTQHENIYCRNKVDAYMYLITTNKKESDNSSCVHIFFFSHICPSYYCITMYIMFSSHGVDMAEMWWAIIHD